MSLSTSELARRLLSAMPETIALVCDCGDCEVEVTPFTTELDVETLIEHAVFDHPARHSILRRETTVLIDDAELKVLLGLA